MKRPHEVALPKNTLAASVVVIFLVDATVDRK